MHQGIAPSPRLQQQLPPITKFPEQGKFVNDADSWGDKLRDAIHMSYTFTNGPYTFSATDTLVIRDRAVVMELYQPAVFAPVDVGSPKETILKQG